MDNFIKNAKNPTKTQNGFFKTSLFSTDVGIKTIEQKGLELQFSSNSCNSSGCKFTANSNIWYILEKFIYSGAMYNSSRKALSGVDICNSIKVKRLFLYMAENILHEWFDYLNLNKINLGSGKRVISKGGKLDKKYNIVIEDLDSI